MRVESVDGWKGLGTIVQVCPRCFLASQPFLPALFAWGNSCAIDHQQQLRLQRQCARLEISLVNNPFGYLHTGLADTMARKENTLVAAAGEW